MKKGDLSARKFPLLSGEQWRNSETILHELYLEVESRAVEACDWYMRDRLHRRAFSRLLRGLAIVFATAGGTVPLVSVTGGGHPSGWGYVFIALAGASVGFDHFLGLSSGWMRDVVTAQKIQKRLQIFQLDWAGMNAHDAFASGVHVVEVNRYLDLIASFVGDLSAIMIEETGEWVAEFQSGVAQLQSQASRKQ